MSKIKEWFEANFLDGDKVQGGQMLSSSFCLEAIKDAVENATERCAEIAEATNKGKDFSDPTANKIAAAIRKKGDND